MITERIIDEKRQATRAHMRGARQAMSRGHVLIGLKTIHISPVERHDVLIAVKDI